MAKCDRGTGQPLEKDPTPQEQDTNIPSKYHQENMENFENMEYENHTTLKTLNRELDHLWHRVETAEGQPTEATNHLEHELHRLSLVIHPSAPQEPLDDVLQPYMESLCTTQK